MATGMGEYEEQVAPIKHDLFGKAFQHGQIQDVVEVGMGTGPNLRYLPGDALKAGDLTCLRPSHCSPGYLLLS